MWYNQKNYGLQNYLLYQAIYILYNKADLDIFDHYMSTD